MSIATAIQNAQAKVAAAYTACDAKGATMPQTQDLSNLADCIDSISAGGEDDEHIYTGHVDTVGLTALGWDSDDIQWLQNHVWWDAEEDAYWAVTEANLAFGPNGATPLTWANRANQKFNPDIRYYPKFDPSPSSGTSWGNLFNGYQFICAIPTHGWDTQFVTSLQGSFAGCVSLRSTGNLSGWNVGRVTSLYLMFNNCTALITPGDLSEWDTENVTNLSQIFGYCYSLVSVGNLSGWKTGKATSFLNLFFECRSLRRLDLSNWDTSKITSMGNMFSSCLSLVSVGDLVEWETGACVNMSNMFASCYSLLSVGDLGNWDTSACQNFSNMFSSCFDLSYVGDLSQWDTSACTNMSNMFSNCKSLNTIGNVNNWDTSKVTSLQGMFNGCFSLKNINCSSWNVEKVTSIYQTFAYCVNLARIDLLDWSLPLCTNFGTAYTTSAFAFCYSLVTLKLGPHFFDGSPTTYYFQGNYCWTRDSVYESLYTNQTLRNSQSTAITVKLYAGVYDSLSAQDISDIATKNITLTRG